MLPRCLLRSLQGRERSLQSARRLITTLDVYEI
jgi:hypothetical protein